MLVLVIDKFDEKYLKVILPNLPKIFCHFFVSYSNLPSVRGKPLSIAINYNNVCLFKQFFIYSYAYSILLAKLYSVLKGRKGSKKPILSHRICVHITSHPFWVHEHNLTCYYRLG